MVLKGSAAYAIPVVIVTSFLVGGLLLTVLDPITQAVFASPMWDPNTTDLGMMLDAVKALTVYLPLLLLFGYLSRGWIWTRRAG